MKKLISVALSLVMLCLILVPVSAADTGIVLANNGVTAYSIVVSENASETEVNAAGVLEDHLQQITGADFTVKSLLV